LQREGIDIDYRLNKIRASVCNGVPLILGGRIPVKARLSEKSDLYVEETEKGTVLKEGERELYAVSVIDAPEWTKEYIEGGKQVSEILKAEFNGTIATTLFGCELKSRGDGCKFCGSKPFSVPNYTVKEFEKALEKALEANPDYCLILNSGSLADAERWKALACPYIEAAKRTGVKKTNLEMMPFERLAITEFLEELKDCGVTSLQPNLEIWDKELRKVFMPYKGAVERGTYLEYLREASRIFGTGKASSVLLVGIENKASLEEGVDAVLGCGGVPSLEAFRPLKGTPLENMQPAYNDREAAELIIYLNSKILRQLDQNGVLENVEGCMKCGGCPTLPDLSKKDLTMRKTM
jgi:hypothetical protein